ncbi:MAG: acetyl-CoA carboxylase, carboxyltransferase subunit beta [Pseudomonadota bacterium]
MSWLSNITPPGIKNLLKRQDDGADTLWVKCDNCGEMIFRRDLEAAQKICPSCDHHMRLTVEERFKGLFDDGAYELIASPEPALDPLKFKDEKRYVDRIKDYRRKSGAQDSMEVAVGKLDGADLVAAVQNFSFMGGSMGMALGEAFIAAAETALERSAPLVVFTASGGARMQEGILSLMQMPRTTVAVQRLREAGLPYIVVLTHPTTGGVTASFAMLGDVHFAEPGALIGFAGPRVIEQTIREKLPQGFQRAEFQLDKGMVDLVVHRRELRGKLSTLLGVLMREGAIASEAAPDDVEPETSPEPVAANEDIALDKAAE